MLEVWLWRINTGANKDVHGHSRDRSLCQALLAAVAISAERMDLAFGRCPSWLWQ